ncbi:MAG: two-component sensor histidine kinase, partial [Alphaproteobacteria bacterium]|nr:two-component sensor histidine kinase [Alphaproteobacteria bacterium]
MGRIDTLPVAGITLAAVTFVALLLLGIDPIVALAVLAVWVGSLLVAAIRPPEPPTVVV